MRRGITDAKTEIKTKEKPPPDEDRMTRNHEWTRHENNFPQWNPNQWKLHPIKSIKTKFPCYITHLHVTLTTWLLKGREHTLWVCIIDDHVGFCNIDPWCHPGPWTLLRAWGDESAERLVNTSLLLFFSFFLSFTGKGGGLLLVWLCVCFGFLHRQDISLSFFS